jgi:hypothetical protein
MRIHVMSSHVMSCRRECTFVIDYFSVIRLVCFIINAIQPIAIEQSEASGKPSGNYMSDIDDR